VVVAQMQQQQLQQQRDLSLVRQLETWQLLG
jgi:hypothetical protein